MPFLAFSQNHFQISMFLPVQFVVQRGVPESNNPNADTKKASLYTRDLLII
jgi:hypothetical protein